MTDAVEISGPRATDPAPTSDGGAVGPSSGRRWFGGTMVAFFFAMAVAWTGDGVSGDAGGFVAAAICMLMSALVVQTNFHPRISWSTEGVVFRGPFVTRAIPWSAVTSFSANPAGADLGAGLVARWTTVVSSPDLQVLRGDHFGRHPSYTARAANALEEYRSRLDVTPAPIGAAAPVVRTASRPGRRAVVWLCVEVVVIGAIALLGSL